MPVLTRSTLLLTQFYQLHLVYFCSQTVSFHNTCRHRSADTDFLCATTSGFGDIPIEVGFLCGLFDIGIAQLMVILSLSPLIGYCSGVHDPTRQTVFQLVTRHPDSLATELL